MSSATKVTAVEAVEDVDKDYDEYHAAGRIWGEVPRDRIKKVKFPRVSQETRDKFLALHDLTTTVSDILDKYGIRGAIPSTHLPALLPGKKIAGTAVTLRNIPERKTSTQGYIDKDRIKMSTREAYYLSEPGDVLVADFGGNLEVSNMGGQSCTVAQSIGFQGAIVNGCVRDLTAIREIGYPVWAKGATQITGKFRLETIEINGPVTVHDIVVYAGDLIVADDSGVCVIPHELVDTVIEEAQAIEKAEDVMRDLIVTKRPLSELRPLFRKRYS